MEKRQNTRLVLGDKGWRAELIEHISGEKLGEVVNLSTGGLMLLTSTKAGIENLFQVKCREPRIIRVSELFRHGSS